MFFTKDHIAVRVRCPLYLGVVEIVYVYGHPLKTTFEPVACNGCGSMSGAPACKHCTEGIVTRLREDLSLLECQPIDPIPKSS